MVSFVSQIGESWENLVYSCKENQNVWIIVFAGGSDSKESACNVGDLSSVPGLGRSPGGGHGNPLQHPCLEIPMDRGDWWAAVHYYGKNVTLKIYCKIVFTVKWCFSSVQFSPQSCPTLCDPMNRSMPGLPVHHQLLELAQTHVHRVGDAI